jgi:hypothetical protein
MTTGDVMGIIFFSVLGAGWLALTITLCISTLKD